MTSDVDPPLYIDSINKPARQRQKGEAWESANEVIPTYFDRVLSGKLARDEEDRDMLELIFDSIVYDNGASYFGFARGVEPLYYTLLRQAIDAKSTNYTSHKGMPQQHSFKNTK